MNESSKQEGPVTSVAGPVPSLAEQWVRDYDQEMIRKNLADDGWRDVGYLSEDGINLVGYDGFGAPLYAHQIPAMGTE